MPHVEPFKNGKIVTGEKAVEIDWLADSFELRPKKLLEAASMMIA